MQKKSLILKNLKKIEPLNTDIMKNESSFNTISDFKIYILPWHKFRLRITGTYQSIK